MYAGNVIYSPVVHDAIGIICSAFSCLELRVTVPVNFEVLTIHIQMLLHPCNVSVRFDQLPEVRSLVFVAQAEGVSKLMDHYVFLIVISNTTSVKVEPHRSIIMLCVLCFLSNDCFTPSIICSEF